MISIGLGWEEFLPCELIGFFLLAVGTLIYNEIWIVPIDFMRKNTKVERAKREGLIESIPYVSLSLTVTFDDYRNKCNIDSKPNDRQKLLNQHN